MTLLGLPPGIPAIILLLIMSIVTTLVCTKIYSPQLSGFRSRVKWFFTSSPAKVRSMATVIIALPFWIWAVYKVATTGDPDLGAISFLLVIISCVSVIAFNINHNSNIPSIMLLISNGLVSLNYALPIFAMTLPFTFYIYLIIGTVYWAFVCLWNWKGCNDDKEEEEELQHGVIDYPTSYGTSQTG